MIGFDESAIQALIDELDAEADEIAACPIPGHDFTRPMPENGDGRFVCAHCPKLLVTQAMIDENLNNAVEGGYDCRFDTPELVIAELMAYSCDCETATEAELEPFVLVWLRRWI